MVATGQSNLGVHYFLVVDTHAPCHYYTCRFVDVLEAIGFYQSVHNGHTLGDEYIIFQASEHFELNLTYRSRGPNSLFL